MSKETDTPKEWTQRAKPNPKGRTRRIGAIFSYTTANRLLLLSRLDGVSVNHELEQLIEAEYNNRMQDKTTAAAIKALEKLEAKKQ